MATILLAATATPGHVNPMLAAARLLVAQGHRVLMLCGALFERHIRDTGAEFVPFAPEVDPEIPSWCCRYCGYGKEGICDGIS